MNQSKVLVDTMTWTPDTDKELILPTEGLITRIDLEVYLYASADQASNMSTLGMWRVIQNLRIQGAGGKNYFSMAGVHMGMLLHFLNLIDFPGITWRSVTAQANYLVFRLHFGSRPRDIYGRDNPFDLTAAIPAHKEAKNNLKLIWTCANTAATDDTITVTATTTVMRATVHQVVGGEAEWAKLGSMVPVSSSEAYDPLATKADLGGVRPVPTGNFVRRIGIMAQDATAVTGFGPILMGDQATELGLKLVKDNRQIIRLRTKTMEVCGSPVLDGAGVVNTPNTQDPFSKAGLYCLDLRQYDDREWGLDTRDMQDGDVELGMTIGSYTSTDTEQIWYDQLQRYGGR